MSPSVRVLFAVSYLLAAFGSLRCARSVVNPSERPVRVFVTDARLERLPLYAAAVKEREATSPAVWLVAGDPFADRSLTALSDGAAPVSLFTRAGVDAVVLAPEWLAFGLPRLNELVSKGRYYALSASVLDETGQTLGHPFMVRKSGSAVIAVTGLAFDSANVLRSLVGVKYVAPAMAAGKAIALMRQRADLVGVMAEPRSSGSGWGADFTVNLNAAGGFAMSPSGDDGLVNCYDLSADASRLTARTQDLGRVQPDTALAWLLDSVGRAADSLAAVPIPPPRIAWTPDRLQGELVRGLLAAKLADGFLCDSLFTADFKNPANVGALVSLLRDPGRPAILSVQGDVLAGWPASLVFRSGLPRTRLSRGQTYHIATTVDFLQRHPLMALPGFELAPRPLWTMCRDVLESGRAQ